MKELAHDRAVFPARPSDISRCTPLGELLDAYHVHELVRQDHRDGIIDPRDAEPLLEHVLAELAVGHALAARLLADRWVTASEALAAGATLGQIAAACGLDVDELRAGMRSGVDGAPPEPPTLCDIGSADGSGQPSTRTATCSLSSV